MPASRNGRRARPADAIAIVLVLGVLASLAFVLLPGRSPADDRRMTDVTNDSTGADGAVYVRQGAGCDDLRAASEAAASATPLCTLTRAFEVVGPGGRVLVEGRQPEFRLEGAVPVGTTLAPAPGKRAEIAGGRLDGVSDLRIEGVRFTDGLALERTAEVTIHRVHFDRAALYLKQTAGTQVLGSAFTDLPGTTRALLAQGGSYKSGAPTTTGLRIVGNRFSRVNHDAIAVYNGYDDVVVSGNLIEDVRQPDGRVHSDCFQAMAGTRLRVEGNVLRRCTHGMILKDGGVTKGLVIRGNVIHDDRGAALEVFDGLDAVIERNTVWRTRYGIQLWDDDRFPGQPAVRLRDNVLDRLAVLGRVRLQGGGNLVGTGGKRGTLVRIGRPAFASRSADDLRLKARAPGAAAGDGRRLGAQASDAQLFARGRAAAARAARER